MDCIEFLGTSGTRTPSEGTTCLKVSGHCVIDTGNLIGGLGNDLFSIEHIFLTHSHLDHIIDIPFVADLFVAKQTVPLKIYALKETLDDLRNFIFNHRIWPNFEEINLLEYNAKTIEFIEICLGQSYPIDDIVLTPFKTNHTDGSCGYLIEKGVNGILFTSDTYRCPEIWKILETTPHIHSLIIDVSFPSDYYRLAQDSKHMTPQILTEELEQCSRHDFRIYPMHLKSLFERTIKEELDRSGIFSRGGHVLKSFECLPYDPNTLPPSKADMDAIRSFRKAPLCV